MYICAPRVTSRAPRLLMAGDATSDCAAASEVAACERTDTEFTPACDARRGECAVSVPVEALPALAADVTGVNHPAHQLGSGELLVLGLGVDVVRGVQQD